MSVNSLSGCTLSGNALSGYAVSGYALSGCSLSGQHRRVGSFIVLMKTEGLAGLRPRVFKTGSTSVMFFSNLGVSRSGTDSGQMLTTAPVLNTPELLLKLVVVVRPCGTLFCARNSWPGSLAVGVRLYRVAVLWRISGTKSVISRYLTSVSPSWSRVSQDSS